MLIRRPLAAFPSTPPQHSINITIRKVNPMSPAIEGLLIIVAIICWFAGTQLPLQPQPRMFVIALGCACLAIAVMGIFGMIHSGIQISS